jgi:hypothetical protein
VLALNVLSLTAVKCEAAWEQVSNNTYYINDDGTYLTGVASNLDVNGFVACKKCKP